MERLVGLILTSDFEVLVVPKLMEEQYGSNCSTEGVIAWNDGDDPYLLVKENFISKNVKRVAVEGSFPYSSFLKLKSMGVEIIETTDDLFSKLRTKKSPYEIEMISAAVTKSERAYMSTIGEITNGISEKEVGEILAHNFARQGLSGPSFKTIVAFGENAAIPHHEPTQRKLRRGDLVLIDFGGSYEGYASDITRTVGFESIDKNWEKIYQTVQRAQMEAIRLINKNTIYADIDNIARNIITEAGYGSNFIHRVGHGLGISVHEEPFLVPGNHEKISEGTVFTVEPGIYIPDKGGVRIEDTLYFDGNKAVSFNSLGKDIVIL